MGDPTQDLKTASDLLDEWESGMRPARVQALRHDLMHHTGLIVPHRRSEIESYMTRMKGQITRWLRAAAEEEDAGRDRE